MNGQDEWEEIKGNEYWKPEQESDAIKGKIVDITEKEDMGTVYTLETSEGTVVLPSHTVLQNRLAKTKVGDEVNIIYTGEEPPKIKGNRPTKMYSVYRKKA